MEKDDQQGGILRFNGVNESPSFSKKYAATAKYNRKTLSMRLELEEWMHDQLRKLYNCQSEDDDYNVEVDVDVLLAEEKSEVRFKMLQELLHGAKESPESFIDELLIRIRKLENAPLKKGADV
ncbi:protein phosphatase 1 regulatory subunit 14B [Hydra vulgaris]|uniref:Protein phosphatase 1 regulatory subunit 14B n=1 Tax=Hydra vulgaris TaxID=6087 RepID=T2M885_HYDVU|nr:protein phosphatase 1 regulatory subunit 14B isoform X1 [Hydra vulgaris]